MYYTFKILGGDTENVLSKHYLTVVCGAKVSYPKTIL